MITKYAKSIVYIALTAVMFLITALSDDALSVEELLNLAVAVIGAVVVYAVPNFSSTVGRYAKTIATAVTAGLLLAISFLTDGISLTEWMQIGVASLAAIGVYIVPNVDGATVKIRPQFTLAPGSVSGQIVGDLHITGRDT